MMEQELRAAKRAYEQITVDKAAFQDRLFRAMSKGEPIRAPRISWKRKAMALAMPLVILPIAAFAYVHYFVWGGAQFGQTDNIDGPTSSDAAPAFVAQTLKQPGTQTSTLSQSVQKATFPIREPGNMAGWTKVLSEGIQFPLYHEAVTANHQEKLVGVTTTPLEYVDIYENDQGQRIAVTQQSNADMSKAYQKSQGLDQGGGFVGWDFGRNYRTLPGFPGNMAWLESGTWSDLKINKPGHFANVVVLHPETNNTVTEIVVDEYGNVNMSTLESFAHAYVNAPVQ